MTTAWTYPWSVLDDSTASFETLTEHGIGGVNVASHYHSIRTFDPSGPEPRFDAYPGGCYFEPNPAHFADVLIEPPVNEVGGHRDSLGEVVDRSGDVDVNAWLVCLHNSKLGTANPEYRTRSTFGTAHDHAFCPSNQAVRDYFAAVVRSLSEYDIREIQLESIGFQNAFHGHGSEFGHDKNQVVTEDAEKILLSQCFCPACEKAAEEHPVDLDRAQTIVQRRCQGLLDGPGGDEVSLDGLCQEYPMLADLFDFRASVIEQFVRELAEASDVALNYYVADGLGHEPDGGWPAGVVPSRLEPYLDRVTALCYVGDPAVARRRVEAIQEAVDLPVDAGITLDPSVVDSRKTWRRVVESVQDRCEEVHVYNEALMTEAHLGWLADLSG